LRVNLNFPPNSDTTLLSAVVEHMASINSSSVYVNSLLFMFVFYFLICIYFFPTFSILSSFAFSFLFSFLH